MHLPLSLCRSMSLFGLNILSLTALALALSTNFPRDTAPIQNKVNTALCALPDKATQKAADAALARGVPYFLDNVLTMNFLPNHKNSLNGWLDYFMTTYDPHNAGTFSSCNAFNQDCISREMTECDTMMELHWNQATIQNFYTYLNNYQSAFAFATSNASAWAGNLGKDFPPQVSVFTGVGLLNNVGAALAMLGGGVSLFDAVVPGSGVAGGVVGLIGGVFSNAGAKLAPPAQEDSTMLLTNRLSILATEVHNSMLSLLRAVMVTGDLSGFPSWTYGKSNYKLSLSAFFDGGKWFYLPDTADLQTKISSQLLVNLAGVAVLEANYYVLKDAYSVKDCPVGPGLTGVVIKDSCFTLEKPGSGPKGIFKSISRSTYSSAMDKTTLSKLVDFYHVSLTDLYTSSSACQNAVHGYWGSVNLQNWGLDVNTMPPCFFNLPVLQVSASTKLSPTKGTPCEIWRKNVTVKASQVGVTFLPPNLSPVFVRTFCDALPFTR